MGIIVDQTGRPFAPASGARASNGSTIPPSSAFPYQAADWSTQENGAWQPYIRSPDTEINQFRDRMVARQRDLIRNDGWAAGAITRILDNTIGTHLRLYVNPDYRALKAMFGGAFDSKWAAEYQQVVEARWRSYATNLGRYNDAQRLCTIGQQFRLAMRHKLVDGEALGVTYWMPERIGRGAADYATALMLVDPDRLSNPMQMQDSEYMRGGVELDLDGAAIAYHIRKAEPNDWYAAIDANTWERVDRFDEDGWRRVIHDYDSDRAAQHRGIGAFTPVLQHAKMLAKYYGIELQAATIASIFGTFVTSPYDPALVQDALADEDAASELGAYQQLRANWAQERPAMLAGAKIPTLAPGEKIDSVDSKHPHSGFNDFAQEMHRVSAACLGISAEQYTQDWSKTNYSSARAALMESWKTLTRRSGDFKTNFATPFFACWLEEAFENGEMPLPRGAPDFAEARTAYSRCDWLSPPRGWIDPVKEKQGAQLGIQMGISTLQREAAEQGLDWEELLDQRALEVARFKELGLELPSWANLQPAGESETGSHDPESPNYNRG